MRLIKPVFWLSACLLLARPSLPDSLSFTGTLTTPTTDFEATFNLLSPGNIIIQTWGFGGSGLAPGGTNAAGNVILAGGFDPMISLFTGPAATAAILVVGGNPVASADNLFGLPPAFTPACPPGSLVAIGSGPGSDVCGDATLALTGLAAGTYTLVLSDANYIPNAVNPGPPGTTTLSSGFADLTGGIFQTCNTNLGGVTTCVTRDSHFAVDITGAGVVAPVPEPAALTLLVSGLAAFLYKKRRKGQDPVRLEITGHV